MNRRQSETKTKAVSAFESETLVQSLAPMVSLALLSLCLTGCLGKGTSTGGSSGSTRPTPAPSDPSKVCAEPVKSSHVAIEIKGGQHVHFDRAAVEAISNPAYVIDSIVLNVEIAGRRKKSDTDVIVGLNGIVATKDDGSRGFDELTESTPNSKATLNLGRLRSNGGLPFASVFGKIFQNKGELRISLQGSSHGSNVKVVSAQLEVSGYRKLPCVVPTPTPAPGPSATPVIPRPNVQIDFVDPLNSPSSKTTLRAEFSSDQPGVSFQCSLDGAPFAPCSSPALYSGLADSSHEFLVKAVNFRGDESELDGHVWSVLATPPQVAIASVPALTNQSSIELSFAAPGAVAYECSLDGAAASDCQSPVRLSGLPEGVRTYSVIGINASGVRSAQALVTWKIDSTPPVAQIVEVVPAESPTSQRGRSIAFAASESARFECSLDSESSFESCESPKALADLSEGTHSFSVRAIDAAGNVGPVSTSSWEIDLTDPVVTFVAAQPAQGLTNARAFSVDFAASEPGSYLCSVDGAEPAACSSPYSTVTDRDGLHRVSIVAIDLAGLRSTPLTLEWTVDTAAAEIRFGAILPSSAASLSTDAVSLAFEADEAMSYSATLNGASLGEVVSPLVLPNLSEGEYSIGITGRDGAGNSSNELIHSFTIDRTAPIVSLSAMESASPTNSTTRRFSFTASESASFECELDGAGFAQCQSSLALTGLIEGEHVFRVRAVDTAGNVSAVSQSVWSVDLTAPISTVTAAQTGATSFRFTISANEPVSSYLCALDGGAEFGCASGYVASGLTPGNHVLVVRATDVAGNKSAAGSSVSVLALAPISLSLANPGLIYTNQTSITFSFSSNRANATFFCSLDNAAPSPCSSLASYSGLANGNRAFSVYAVDPWGQASNVASHAWTVDTVVPLIVTSSNSTQSTSITVNWTTNELATSFLRWGPGSDTSRATSETSSSQISHSALLTGLAPNTLYSIQITGRDRAGNVYLGPRVQVRTRF